MWQLVVIIIIFIVRAIITTPTIAQNYVITKDFHKMTQNFQTVLMSMEERLHNLNTIYSSKSLVENKFDRYNEKLDTINVKLNKIESKIMLNLENFHVRPLFNDENLKMNNLMKKIDIIYEGINHKLNSIDRKIDMTFNKMQGKLETISAVIDKMEENLTIRDENLDTELTDTIAVIDDLKTTHSIMEENILANTKAELKKFLNNNELKIIKEDLNEYAIKVGEMNSENWKTNKLLLEKQEVIENFMSKIFDGNMKEIIGKLLNNKDYLILNDVTDLNEKFEKIFKAQNQFMDNCYRLQMDESQIEWKISLILEKLIETFDKKTAVEIKDIKNLEKLIKTHDSHIITNLYQISLNIVKFYNKTMDIKENLEEYLENMENTEENSLKFTSILNNLQNMERSILVLNKTNLNEINLLLEIKGNFTKEMTKTIETINEILYKIELKIRNLVVSENQSEKKLDKNTIKQIKQEKLNKNEEYDDYIEGTTENEEIPF